MLSSTSSSSLRRATIALLAALALLLGAAEVGSRLFGRVSRVQRRTEADRASLADLSAAPVVLVIGNSLLLEGLDFPGFAQALSPHWDSRRFVVEQTYYLDWYYGLRRLFHEGVRPRAVVLGLNPAQFASPVFRGDYSARYLVDASDIPLLVRETHSDLSTGAGLVLAHYSAFFALRGSIRQYLLDKPLPGYFPMAQRFFVSRGPAIPPGRLAGIAVERLREMQVLCRQNGAEFMLTIPPNREPGEDGILRAGEQTGVAVLVPIRNGTLDRTYYRDGFHLNERGAALYTPALAMAVNARLAEISGSVPSAAGRLVPHR